MASISWDMDDPIVKNVKFEQDKTRQWNVIVTLHEHWRDSLGAKVVKGKLVHEGMIFDKDIDSVTWTPATTRSERGRRPSESIMTFHTQSEDYPEKAKVEIEVTEA